MGSFGIARHAHVDAAVFSVVLTVLTYGVKWLFGWGFPSFFFGLPFFLAVFLGYYLAWSVAFLVLWSRR